MSMSLFGFKLNFLDDLKQNSLIKCADNNSLHVSCRWAVITTIQEKRIKYTEYGNASKSVP